MYLNEKESALQNNDFTKLFALIDTDRFWSSRLIDNAETFEDQYDILRKHAIENGTLLANACYKLAKMALESEN